MDASARPPRLFPSLGWLFGCALLVSLAGRPALADPSDGVDSIVLAALPAAISFSLSESLSESVSARVQSENIQSGTQTRARSSESNPPAAETASLPTISVDALSEIPWRAPTTDETLAAAVALGSTPDLEPKKPFRKRSNDLFRSERPVEIGQRQMLLRVRVRPKTRETMSVELRF